MKLKDVILRTASIVGLEVDTDTPSPALTKLVDCANAVYSLLVLEHVPLKTKEQIAFTGGKAYFANFAENVREILKISVDGVRRPFSVYPKYVEAEDLEGEATVTYLYYTGTLEVEDELILPTQFTEYVMALGVASEYFYRIGFIDEAEFYRSRFDSAVLNCSRSERAAFLPARRYI